jgi:ketosteroid isomerase-like protein
MSLAAFESAVQPLLAELAASANAHDADRHMAVYAREPSLTFVFNGQIVRGWDQLREWQHRAWNDGNAKGSYRYAGSPIVEALGNDCGHTIALIAATKEADGGSSVERILAHSALWRRRPEGWRIVFAHESSG